MTKIAKRPNSIWATGVRRELDEARAKKAGYPGALREETGWFRGARVRRK
jgi:hypothetical protein